MARDQLNILLLPNERAALEAIVARERERAAELGVAAGTITAGSVIRLWIREHAEKMTPKPAPATAKRK